MCFKMNFSRTDVGRLRVKIYSKDWSKLKVARNVFLILLYYDTILFSVREHTCMLRVCVHLYMHVCAVCAYACVCVSTYLSVKKRKEQRMNKENQEYYCLTFFILLISGGS